MNFYVKSALIISAVVFAIAVFIHFKYNR